MATTVIATATTTIVARCGCCGGTGGGSGGSGRSRRSCGSRCWARLVGIELRHLGCATDVFGSTITRLPTLPRLAVQRIFFQRSEEHTSELQSLMRISYAVFCLKKKKTHTYICVDISKHHNHIH